MLVLTKIAITVGSFGIFFYSLSPCVSGPRKIRGALSIFGIEMGVRGPSPVLVSYNISQGGQALRNAGSLLKFIQTPAQSATDLLKNKFSVKMLICFLCLKKASHEKHLGSIFKSICKHIYSDDKKRQAELFDFFNVM